ncbi:MAG: acylphosphatase [Patescibacteria group bacterium]
MKAILLKITGRVQGVFFRAETKRVADSLGITGWVQNSEDGSVEVFAQGEEETLRKLEQWCSRGPKAAEVQKVQRGERALDETCRSFEIHYEWE